MATLSTAALVHERTDRERHIPRLSQLCFAALVVVTFALTGCGGGGSSTADVQPQSVPAGTGTATLKWSAPTTNADGTPLTTLAGYKVYYGTTSGVYTSLVVGNVTSYEFAGLTKGQTYYFTVTAYDTHGNESDYAPEASKLIN